LNTTIETILKRNSVRNFETRPVEPEIKEQILEASLRSPTAGNLMLYSIIEVNDGNTKNILAKTCDNQPFIAKAPWVLLFLADYQRWYDYFLTCDVEKFCARNGMIMRRPAEGDLMLACCDAIIAAQTAVIAAESLGVGSCYIGDIMENYETHKSLFDLPRYTFPICLLCLGYPDLTTKLERKQTSRFDRRFIIFHDKYARLKTEEFEDMFQEETNLRVSGSRVSEETTNIGQRIYRRKFGASFATEMNRSVRCIMQNWTTA
jgi:nitroreductase